jgi:hypothetical protein
MRRSSSKRAEPMRATKKQRTRTTVRLVPTTTSIPLVDLGLGAEVSIRFPVTGPVVEIMRVSEVSGDWVGHLVATLLARRARP